jgi:aspartate racemase
MVRWRLITNIRREMKKIGLVGGLAWLSTIEYYSEIHRAVETQFTNTAYLERQSSLEMSIESLDLKTALSYLGSEGDESTWSKFDTYHRDALLRLQQSGAECAAIASNTPHARFDSIVRGVEIRVVDIFTVVAEEAASRGLRHVLILGTPLTMMSQRFRLVLSSHGVRAIEVTDEEAVSETFDLIGRLQCGRMQEAAEEIEGIVRRIWKAPPQAQPCVILACTELPLAFEESVRESVFVSGDITYINPMAVHIRAILNYAQTGR